MAKWTARVGKFNQVLWKSKKFLPSNITDTVFDATGITKKFFTASEQASRTKRVLTYGLKQFIGEGAQGLVESTVNQIEAMENGFQERFSFSAVGYNMLEEGIGGLALGGPIRFAGNTAEALTTTKAGKYVTKKLGEVRAAAI
jgi:D-serine dehydratase